MGKWIDISFPLNNQIAVWPGDTPFHYQLSTTKDEKNYANIGRINMSPHTGTHIDAPFHIDSMGKKVLELDVNIYMGPAKIIDVTGFTSIGAEELASYDLQNAKRLLLRTWEGPRDPSQFPHHFTYLRPDIVPLLNNLNIRLIGVDTPSVDAIDSEDLATHHALVNAGVHILENLKLDHVQPGDCELSALPLPLQDGDGSPVRAVIRYPD